MFFAHHNISAAPVKKAIKWAAAEYYYLQKLQLSLRKIPKTHNLKRAKHILRFISKSERRVERNLSHIHKAIETYPSLLSLETKYEVAKNKLLAAFSLYQGEFTQELEALTSILSRSWRLKLFGRSSEVQDAQERIEKIVSDIETQLAILARWTKSLELGLRTFETELISRRDFMKTAATAASGIAVVGSATSAEAKGKRKVAFIPLPRAKWMNILRPRNAYGIQILCDTTYHSTRKIAEKYDVQPALIKDMSRKFGGEIAGHLSHKDGRDVDVGNYVFTGSSYTSIFWRLGKTQMNDKTWQINWDFITILQQDWPVTKIFWNKEYIREMRKYVYKLYGKEKGKEEWKKYGRILQHANGHKNHFHIRVSRNR